MLAANSQGCRPRWPSNSFPDSHLLHILPVYLLAGTAPLSLSHPQPAQEPQGNLWLRLNQSWQEIGQGNSHERALEEKAGFLFVCLLGWFFKITKEWAGCETAWSGGWGPSLFCFSGSWPFPRWWQPPHLPVSNSTPWLLGLGHMGLYTPIKEGWLHLAEPAWGAGWILLLKLAHSRLQMLRTYCGKLYLLNSCWKGLHRGRQTTPLVLTQWCLCDYSLEIIALTITNLFWDRLIL